MIDDMDTAQIKLAVDAVLARTGMQVSPEEYARWLDVYPSLRARSAALRIPEGRSSEPSSIYSPRPEVRDPG